MPKDQFTKDTEIRRWIENIVRKTECPIWRLTQEGTDTSVNWKIHKPNQRFAIYDSGTPNDLLDDLVLDKETGLVWTRNANPIGEKNWLDANTLCREFVSGDRAGWRLPSVEELSSLIGPQQLNPALPSGHPFINVQYGSGVYAYWSSTNSENPSSSAWFVNLGDGKAGLAIKSILGYVWPVRGGKGGNNWNW
jgi:hypothetical protein